MALERFQGSLKRGWMKPGAWRAAPGFGPNFQFAHPPSPILPSPLCCNLLVRSFIPGYIIPDPVGGKGPHKSRNFSEVTRTPAFYSFFNLEEAELRDVVFPRQTPPHPKQNMWRPAEDGSERTVSSHYICINKKINKKMGPGRPPVLSLHPCVNGCTRFPAQ